ncbi:bifunctional 4-alpha-glucanotransferase/amylo-alpha-1,6-glucosidase [Lachancea thermotolerans CBS 6340]|uniref:Glycogen debranching enzyme n=1 Tax=Lachancea thermotolerans (strain ATCC 56472 / CBS 6340 / NRRL Y-8284) TaxID=559295 RepID=C5DB95_LACTC|nr:KLTH0A00726p [Lachancea thermotolerans CBS 6340]CAR21052.1 KLTH0A00726p [Lachancea thermotolerans CBS 6340]
MERQLLLRVSGKGEPVVSCSYGQGVLTLPSLPVYDGYDESSPLFTVKLVIPGGSPVARDGLVWTNCPVDAKTPFVRDKFNKKEIKATFHQDHHVELPVFRPGPFCFYFSFRNDRDELETTRRFYFVVPPSLYIDDRYIPLNSLTMQSVVSKWMGSDWDKIFGKIASKGYNLIHFTPLQKRGDSNSPYSIYDQLEFDPAFFPNNIDDVSKMVLKLHKEHGILAMTDVVLNHTANNSPWLREHPDSGYNHKTAPHLISAMELDKQLLEFSGKLRQLGYPTELNSTHDLFKIMDGIKIHVLGSLKLWEYYVIDANQALDMVKNDWRQASHDQVEIPDSAKNDLVELANFIRDSASCENFGHLGERFSNRLEGSKFVAILKTLYGFELNDAVLEEAQKIVDEINLPLYREYDEDIGDILEQLFNRIKYLRVDDHGPKLGPVTDKSPLTEPYFTRFNGSDGEEYALANNGWIWNGNPLVDFASSQSKAYLRREVIVWGDCVKLRYGAKPEDSPFLWKKMSEYIETCAKLFDGFRIDNCHSTPLHVGEYYLDLARRHKPNLYVAAELFSGSEAMDCLFVERLGTSSLIREAMQAWSEEELSRLVHRHGGRPIGSYKFMPLDDFAYPTNRQVEEFHIHNAKRVSEVNIPKNLTATPPHALFMDCTHDNETPFQKRTLEDTLPNAALVSFCSSAIGSVYGYDECFPYLLDVVGEARTYDVTANDGISVARAQLHKIRDEIAQGSADIEDSEMHVHHEGQYITFQRNNAKNGSGWFLVARTKFGEKGEQKLPKIKFTGSRCEFSFAYSLLKAGGVPEDKNIIKGIPSKLEELSGFKVDYNEDLGESTIEITDSFPQGSIAVFKTQQNGIDETLLKFLTTGALKASEQLNLYSLNGLLYRCDAEERDISAGSSGVYDVPDFGRLTYCGLQGWVSVLRKIIFSNDLAHPMSNHLRSGHWALDYVVQRLENYKEQPGISEMQAWLASRFDRVKKLPSFLVPTYFALVIGIAYQCCRFRAIQNMPENVGSSTRFVQSLALTSVQMLSEMRSTSLIPEKNVPCMAAGLPHFSTDYMRCWGRDVFISLRGLLLTTARFDDAKQHILAFARTLKHGLIPNLLDAGRNPRYNARDATWLFIQSIQDYVKMAPDGESILREKIPRRFPLDDTYITVDDPRAFSYETSIEDIIFEILSRHAKGISYREANAGPQLDRVMSDRGFDVKIHVDWSTGLIHGGSQYNCGTWMDKMGESEKAGSFGVPGTPRDGAAVEISGLLKSALRFVLELHEKKLFKYTKVEKEDGSQVTFKEWNNLVQENFEAKYFVPSDPSKDSEYDIDETLVNRRGIYKDLYKAGKPYEDYQLRPNFAIAMTVAPELFTPELALQALDNADRIIRGPVGMRTLDPSDYNYRPNYNNGEDSADFATSKGRNYHQGPEWVWCYGYFMRAFYRFHLAADARCQSKGSSKPSSYLYQQLYNRFEGQRNFIYGSPWAGLTELTNKDGALCSDSSPTQAWSSATTLDFFYDLWEH